jgi:hypothetical protein
MKLGKENPMKKKVKTGFPLSDLGHCSAFTNYCPKKVWSFIFQLAHTDNTKKEAEKACKDLSENNRGIVRRNLTFTASETACVAFSMGYVMGQLYNVKDREHLPVLRKLFKKQLISEVVERKKGERKSLPYIGKNQKNMEKKAA